MQGHVFWLRSDMIKVIKNMLEISERKATLAEYEKVLLPLLSQAALEEQAYLIQKLVNSGMTHEEVAFRLQRPVEFIKTICDMELQYEYDYSYIKGAKRSKDDERPHGLFYVR